MSKTKTNKQNITKELQDKKSKDNQNKQSTPKKKKKK